MAPQSSEKDERTAEEMEQLFHHKMLRYHSERVKRGMAKKVEEGFHVNRTPIGYRRIAVGRQWLIEPDPTQAVLVHQAFILAAEGSTSVRKLLKAMTEQGLANEQGKPLSVSGFHSMLTNPFYAGRIRSGETFASGQHEPIISLATFERVQQIFRASRRRDSAGWSGGIVRINETVLI